MPIPIPTDNESKSQFINRCLADKTMVEEYENVSQRYAVCLTSWEDNNQKASEDKKPQQ